MSAPETAEISRKLNVEIVQCACWDGEFAHNLEATLRIIAEADPSTDLLIFPETQLSGFPSAANVGVNAVPLENPAFDQIRRACRDQCCAVAVGFSEEDNGHFYNSSVLIDADRIVGHYRKTHLWLTDQGVFAAGDKLSTFTWRGITVGLLICFDIEFPEPARVLGNLGAELVIVTNGNMDPYGPVHRSAVIARATENQCFVAMANRIGAGPDDMVFAGGSMIVGPDGIVLGEAGRGDCRLRGTLDFGRVSEARRVYNYGLAARIPLAGEVNEQGNRRDFLIPRIVPNDTIDRCP